MPSMSNFSVNQLVMYVSYISPFREKINKNYTKGKVTELLILGYKHKKLKINDRARQIRYATCKYTPIK